jgi:hypothetical protein
MTATERRVSALRAERDRLDLRRDEIWLAFMRAKPGPVHDELLAVLTSLDARIARKGREIAALHGRAERYLEAV